MEQEAGAYSRPAHVSRVFKLNMKRSPPQDALRSFDFLNNVNSVVGSPELKHTSEEELQMETPRLELIAVQKRREIR